MKYGPFSSYEQAEAATSLVEFLIRYRKMDSKSAQEYLAEIFMRQKGLGKYQADNSFYKDVEKMIYPHSPIGDIFDDDSPFFRFVDTLNKFDNKITHMYVSMIFAKTPYEMDIIRSTINISLKKREVVNGIFIKYFHQA